MLHVLYYTCVFYSMPYLYRVIVVVLQKRLVVLDAASLDKTWTIKSMFIIAILTYIMYCLYRTKRNFREIQLI